MIISCGKCQTRLFFCQVCHLPPLTEIACINKCNIEIVSLEMICFLWVMKRSQNQIQFVSQPDLKKKRKKKHPHRSFNFNQKAKVLHLFKCFKINCINCRKLSFENHNQSYRDGLMQTKYFLKSKSFVRHVYSKCNTKYAQLNL